MMDNTLAAARLMACKKAPYLAPAIFGMRMQRFTNVDWFIRISADGQCDYCQETLEAKDAWNVPQLSGLLVHECWHRLRRHFVRANAALKGVVPPSIEGDLTVIYADLGVLWNMAADLAINDGMLQQGFSLPKWGLFAKDFQWEQFKTAEFYLEKLLKGANKDMYKLRNQLAEAKLTPDEFAKIMQRPCNSPEPGLEQRLFEKVIAQRIQAHASKHFSNLPDDQVRWADEQLLTPKVRWEDELRHGLRSVLNRGDGQYSWRRTNRRKTDDILFPGYASHRPTVVIVEDTSGSMGSAELQRARSETAAVIKTLQAPVTVLCCDAAVASVQKLYDIRQLKLVGGGGTDMALGITQAAALSPRPEVVICLTDGYTGWPATQPQGSKFITVLVGGGEGPTFGKVIRAT